MNDAQDRQFLEHFILTRAIEEKMLIYLRQGKVSKWFASYGQEAMLHDPAISLIWNQQQIRDGILDRIPQSEIIGMFEAISHRSDLHDFDH